MFSLRLASAALVLCSLGTAALAQTANSASPSASGSGSNGVQQFPSGGSSSPGTTGGQNAATQFPSGGAGAPGSGSKIGAPTAVEQREQQKSNQDMTICKGC